MIRIGGAWRHVWLPSPLLFTNYDSPRECLSRFQCWRAILLSMQSGESGIRKWVFVLVIVWTGPALADPVATGSGDTQGVARFADVDSPAPPAVERATQPTEAPPQQGFESEVDRFTQRRAFTEALMERRQQESQAREEAEFDAAVEQFVRRYEAAQRLVSAQLEREAEEFAAAATLEARKRAFTQRLLDTRSDAGASSPRKSQAPISPQLQRSSGFPSH